ncbi:MAG: hemolysin family protein [Clostridiales bacterium]|nr:hemolysin family protein [Clostridiales bacterium]
MDGTLFQIIFMLVLLGLSAFFSSTETAFSSLNKTRLKNLAEHGNRRAEKALDLAERYDDLLSTLLIGNNIVNIALASIATVFFVDLIGSSGVSVSTAVTTVIVLIFGEVSPKSLAKEMPESFAMAVTPVFRALVAFFKPINWLFAKWKQLLASLLKIQNDHKVTSDELLTIVEEAEQEGGMNAEESELLKSAIEFHDQAVEDILTPRVRVVGVAQDATADEIAREFEESGYSRLPVYEETLDHIIGVLHQKDFFRQYHAGKFDLQSIMKTPVFVGETQKISNLMRLMQKNKCQLAVVVDEYGGTVGIITMEDILEELVGEIWDEHDEVEVSMEETSTGAWMVQGSAPLEELTERFGLGEDAESSTVGGFMMQLAECVPQKGDVFLVDQWEITVVDADERHVEEIQISPRKDLPAQTTAEA